MGYTSVSAFNHVFKRETEITPKAWRLMTGQRCRIPPLHLHFLRIYWSNHKIVLVRCPVCQE
ncbi:helix-turn-helix transcriptional regulator [Salmonella enterica subsp. enterica serovar Saintpaul]|nr:helix-turn-helix transcriptional regulator [Salmonella enterica subsp. enterica serovar Saintpaul]